MKNTSTNIQTKSYRNLVAVPFPELMTSEYERESWQKLMLVYA